MLQEQFIQYIEKQSLCNRNDGIVLAVSGGIDSVTMLDLFINAGFKKCVLAHCNFSLRGEESDGDERFVESLARKYSIPFFSKKFDTLDYARERGVSIQMAARELRYDWLELCREENVCRFIALAHNKNDVVETFLLNISRGTGLKGLSGIKPKNRELIRPLLFASRKEIDVYVAENALPYREDSSNATVKYKRNKIRHNIIPLFEELNEAFIESCAENIQYIRGQEQMLNHYKGFLRKKLMEYRNGICYISIEQLKALSPLAIYLHELLEEFGFSKQQLLDIAYAVEHDAPPGKIFISPTHKLNKDRESLQVVPRKEMDVKKYYIGIEDTLIEQPLKISVQLFPNTSGLTIEKSPFIAYLDADKLTFPIILRKWEKGDFFMPLGMKNFKKLSDFFRDEKMSLIEKENAWIVANGEDIVWIIGHRIDERYKLSPESQQVVRLKWENSK